MKTSTFLLLLSLLTFSKLGQSQITSISAYPNPFASEATIHFEIEHTDSVYLSVLDMTGKIIHIFYNSVVLPAGAYDVNLMGDTLVNGVYLVQLKCGVDDAKVVKIVKNSSLAVSQNGSITESEFLFPNPTNTHFTVAIEGLKKIDFYNLDGHLAKTIYSIDTQISTEGIPKGVYLLNIQINDNKPIIVNKKVVIN